MEKHSFQKKKKRKQKKKKKKKYKGKQKGEKKNLKKKGKEKVHKDKENHIIFISWSKHYLVFILSQYILIKLVLLTHFQTYTFILCGN